MRAGKHAELWSQKANPSPKPKNKDEKSPNKGPKHHPKLTAFNCEDDDIDDCFGGEEGEDYDAAEFQFKGDLDLLRQRMIEANNTKKGIAIGRIPGPLTGIGKMNNNNNNINNKTGKQIEPNQQMGIKNNQSGIDQKTLAALKMNNAQHFGAGRGSINLGEAKRPNSNDLNSMMNMAGFNGNNLVNFATPSSIGVNPNTSQGGNGYGFPMATGQYQQQQQQPQPTSINGYNQYHQQQQQQQQPLMNMNMTNMLNREAGMNQQPQMMYNRAQLVQPNTGYYYNNYNFSPVHPSYYPPYVEAGYQQQHHGHYSNSATADMFSDENTSSSCSIM